MADKQPNFYQAQTAGLYEVDPVGANTTAGGKSDPSDIGGYAGELKPKASKDSSQAGIIDIVEDYPWTLTNTKGRYDIPYVMLKEYRVNETSIKRQALFYLSGAPAAAKDAALPIGKSIVGQSRKGALDMYDELFPRDNPTGWRYKFPYFNDVNMSLQTAAWQSVDGAGAAGGLMEQLGSVGEFINKAATAATNIAQMSLALQYPKVGVMDRPKVFSEHTQKSITIDFPLYNTISTPKDSKEAKEYWVKNREFLFLFMNQNLFNKRDFVTGMSPVFYEVYIPGTFYSVACAVTDISVKNLGNTRLMFEQNSGGIVVPDAYQVSITLSDMLMPSRNLWQAIDSDEALHRVQTSKGSESKLTEQFGEFKKNIEGIIGMGGEGKKGTQGNTPQTATPTPVAKPPARVPGRTGRLPGSDGGLAS